MPAVEHLPVVERHSRVMASSLHLVVVGPRARSDDRGLDDVESYLQHLERCWSRFIPTSDISRINRLGRTGGGRLTVDPSTITLLTAMIEGHQCTSGRYDPTMLPALIAAGYAASWLDPSQSVDLADAVGAWPNPTLYDVDINPATNTVTVPPGLTLDAGGIGKGLAADLAVTRLLAAGAAGALVGIGGDLATSGFPVDDAGWLVQVEHPVPTESVFCSLAISGGGVATSSTRSRRWVLNGVEHHHQIDPATERSSTTDLGTVTVIAQTGWLAEVHATAALAAGSHDVVAYLDRHGLSGIAFVHGDPTVLMTGDVAACTRPCLDAR